MRDSKLEKQPEHYYKARASLQVLFSCRATFFRAIVRRGSAAGRRVIQKLVEHDGLLRLLGAGVVRFFPLQPHVFRRSGP